MIPLEPEPIGPRRPRPIRNNSSVAAHWINRALILLAWAGVFIAGVLSLTKHLNLQVPCGANVDCDRLARDPSSSWFGIPVADFGLAAYLALAGCAALRLWLGFEKGYKFTVLAFLISLLGTAVSIYLVLLSLTVLHLTCYWCLASAAVMTVTFLLSGWLAALGPRQATSGPFEFAYFGVCAMLAFGAIFVRINGLRQVALETGLKQDDVVALTLENLVDAQTHTSGPADAPVTIVEFGDLLCGTCRSTHEVLKRVQAQSQGRIRLAYHHFPLFGREGHEMSLRAALATEYAATQGKFWEFLDLILTAPESDVKTEEGILRLGESLGLSRQGLVEAMSNGDQALFDKVYADYAKGRKLGVDRTPTFVVFAKGQPPLDTTGAGIEGLLERPEIARLWRSGGPVR